MRAERTLHLIHRHSPTHTHTQALRHTQKLIRSKCDEKNHGLDRTYSKELYFQLIKDVCTIPLITIIRSYMNAISYENVFFSGINFNLDTAFFYDSINRNLS